MDTLPLEPGHQTPWILQTEKITSVESYCNTVKDRPIVAFFHREAKKVRMLMKGSSRLGDDAWLITGFKGDVYPGYTKLKVAVRVLTPKNGWEAAEFSQETDFLKEALKVLEPKT